MDVFSRLKLGDKLSIERYTRDATPDKKNILSAQLIDLRGETIYISTPSYKGKRYFLSNGQNIGIFFYRDTAVYHFYARVVGQAYTNITAFMVKPTGGLYRMQRRNHYRLPIIMNIVLERERNGEIHKLECVVKDLSGGGIRAVCSEELEEGESIKTWLKLHKNKTVLVDGKVMRVIEDRANNCYELGIKFNRISQADEDKIYSFIFERQRLLRRRGLM